MSDRIFPSGPVDLSRVDLTEEHEFLYWTEQFACTPQQLIDALGSAGVDAAAVGRYFASVRLPASNMASPNGAERAGPAQRTTDTGSMPP